MFFGGGANACESLKTHLENGEDDDAIRLSPVCYLACPGILDACLVKESFYEATMYEINTLTNFKKYVEANSIYRKWNNREGCWTHADVSFLENYRNGDWAMWYMDGYVVPQPSRIEMVTETTQYKDENGEMHETVT